LHERLLPAGNAGFHRINRGGGGDEEGAPVLSSPVQVRRQLRHRHLTQKLTGGVVDPEAARRGYPDVAFGIALHAVRHPRLQAVLDARGEDTPGAKAAVGAYLEDADVGLLGVVDIEEALVRREAEPIGLRSEEHTSELQS